MKLSTHEFYLRPEFKQKSQKLFMEQTHFGLMQESFIQKMVEKEKELEYSIVEKVLEEKGFAKMENLGRRITRAVHYGKENAVEYWVDFNKKDRVFLCTIYSENAFDCEPGKVKNTITKKVNYLEEFAISTM